MLELTHMRWLLTLNIWMKVLMAIVLIQVLLGIIVSDWTMKLSFGILIILIPYWVAMLLRSVDLIYLMHRKSHAKEEDYQQPSLLSFSLFPQIMAVAALTLIPPFIVVNLVFSLKNNTDSNAAVVSAILLFSAVCLWFFLFVEPVLKKDLSPNVQKL